MTTDNEPSTPDKPAPAKAKPAAKPARDLPTPDQIGAWMKGTDLPSLAHLFDVPSLKLFDALVMQIRKEELLPQHWQVISQRRVPDALDFQDLGEIQRLRRLYSDGKVLQDRLAALEVAWRELGGKQPALWTVADLFAALRRIVDNDIDVDIHALLSGVRDIWAGMSLPHGRTQLDHLWAVLLFVRSKTKK